MEKGSEREGVLIKCHKEGGNERGNGEGEWEGGEGRASLSLSESSLE